MVCQPRGRLFTRAEFERLSFDTAHLQDVLHEATRVGLIAPFPTGERPCCAVTFRFLLEDASATLWRAADLDRALDPYGDVAEVRDWRERYTLARQTLQHR
jgi:hypothetical protein